MNVVLFKRVFFGILLTSTIAESRDSAQTRTQTDDYKLQLFLKELFGEIWGYYLGWIFSVPPTLVVLPAKIEFHKKNHTNKRSTIASSSSHLGHIQTSRNRIVPKQTCERQSCEEITVSKFVAMIVCFGIFGIMAAIPEWKEGKHRICASSEQNSNEYNCTKNTNYRSLKCPKNASPNSLSAPKHNELFIDGDVEIQNANLIENIKVRYADGTVVTFDKSSIS